MQPVRPAAHHGRLDRKQNLRQGRFYLTVRSCTAEFHQDRSMPGASAVLKLSSDVLSQFHLGSMWLNPEGHFCLEWKVTLICPPLISPKSIWCFFPF